MEKETTNVKSQNIPPALKSKRNELNKMLQDEKCNELVLSTKEMEKTWITKFPFLKGDLQISQIYELYLPPTTDHSVETKTEVLNHNEVGQENNPDF